MRHRDKKAAEEAMLGSAQGMPQPPAPMEVKRGHHWVVVGDQAFKLEDLANATFKMVKEAGSNNPGFDLPGWFFTGSPFGAQIVALGCQAYPVPKDFQPEFLPDLGQVWRSRRPLWECYTTLSAITAHPAADVQAEAVAILERTVLAVLVEARRCNGEFCFVRIAKIEEASGLGPELIRAILRQLVDQGLAEYSRGLFTEDGEVAGSGYAATLGGVAQRKVVS